MAQTLLITASARTDGSVTRALSTELATRLGQPVQHRDLSTGLPAVDEAWVAANFTDPEARSDADRAALTLSDTLVDELKAADTIVIGMPIYNFSVPAALKAWIDLISRARVTFRYTETGPEGLLTGKKAYIVAASGGVPVDSPVDFATPYLRHVLGFLGITDVTVIDASNAMVRGEAAMTDAKAEIDRLAAA